ncbi:MAG: DM13 domain-containing protein [Bacteroidota bacterium]
MKKLLLFVPALLLVLLVNGQEINLSGKWTKKSYTVNGSWKITKSGNTYQVTLDNDFKTKSAPDLKIFLSKKEAGQLNSKNATDGAVLVSKLNKASGGQSYQISESVDLSQYKSILIHCEQYSVLWGVANLTNQ